jgi:hypothetical protein
MAVEGARYVRAPPVVGRGCETVSRQSATPSAATEGVAMATPHRLLEPGGITMLTVTLSSNLTKSTCRPHLASLGSYDPSNTELGPIVTILIVIAALLVFRLTAQLLGLVAAVFVAALRAAFSIVLTSLLVGGLVVLFIVGWLAGRDDVSAALISMSAG